MKKNITTIAGLEFESATNQELREKVKNKIIDKHAEIVQKNKELKVIKKEVKGLYKWYQPDPEIDKIIGKNNKSVENT